MLKDASFVIDLGKEITREDFERQLEHAIASLCMLPHDEECDGLRRDIATPLILLHNHFYYGANRFQL